MRLTVNLFLSKSQYVYELWASVEFLSVLVRKLPELFTW